MEWKERRVGKPWHPPDVFCVFALCDSIDRSTEMIPRGCKISMMLQSFASNYTHLLNQISIRTICLMNCLRRHVE